jgi:hypothetical protein
MVLKVLIVDSCGMSGSGKGRALLREFLCWGKSIKQVAASLDVVPAPSAHVAFARSGSCDSAARPDQSDMSF